MLVLLFWGQGLYIATEDVFNMYSWASFPSLFICLVFRKLHYGPSGIFLLLFFTFFLRRQDDFLTENLRRSFLLKPASCIMVSLPRVFYGSLAGGTSRVMKGHLPHVQCFLQQVAGTLG